MKISLKDIIQTVLFASIGGFILWLLWQNQQSAYAEECVLKNIAAEDCKLWEKLLSDFAGTKTIWIVMICVVYMLGNLCRALRWNQLLAPIGIRPHLYNSFFSVMVGYFVNLGIPRSGEFARGALLSKYERHPFEKVFGTIIMDRILDVVALLFCLALGFIFCYDELWNYIKDKVPGLMDNLLLYGSILTVLGLIGLGILYYFFKRTENTTNAFIIKVKSTIEGLWNGLKSVSKVKNVPLLVLYSVAIWLSYYLMTYLLFFAFAPTSHLTPEAGLLVFNFGALGIVFPSPGGMGTYHAMIMQALSILGVDELSGFSFAMISFFSINVFCNILFGLIGLVLLPILNRES